MKTLFTLFAFCVIISMNAQAPFWTEDFENSCTSNCIASSYTGPNGTWAISTTGTNDPYYNEWYISCAENGNAATTCGTGCGTDESLHLGGDVLGLVGDAGAAYNAGGLCGFGICVITNRRAESPIINCSGQTSITLDFNYIENGQTILDNATLWYYDGAIWSLLLDLPKPPLGVCAPQGQWTAFSIALPVSANNNANVKIGFNWTNNDDGVGTDPSFAVDDIVISGIAAGGPTITTGTPTPASPYCAGVSITVPYTITGSFTGGNIFTAQLSDGVGSFASPTSIGSLASTAAGSISCVIPASTPTGLGYLIRVISSTPSVIGSSSAVITINALPTPTSSNTGPYCAGATIQLNSTGGGTYLWSGPLAYSNSTQNPTIDSSTVDMTGVYTITVTSGSGCTLTSTTTVIVNTLPVPTANNTGPYCKDATIQLNSPSGSATDDWVGPNSYIATNIQNPTIANSTVAMSGVYTVTVTDVNGCSATATTSVTVFDCTGIDDEETIQINVYPNPTSGLFTISLNENIIGNAKITLLNMVGQMIYTITPKQAKTMINAESLGLKAGIYLVQIKYMDQNKVVRLIVK